MSKGEIAEQLEAGEFLGTYSEHKMPFAGVHKGVLHDGELPPTVDGFVATDRGIGVEVVAFDVERTEDGVELDLDARSERIVREYPREVGALIKTVVSTHCELEAEAIHLRSVELPEDLLERMGVVEDYLPLPAAA